MCSWQFEFLQVPPQFWVSSSSDTCHWLMEASEHVQNFGSGPRQALTGRRKQVAKDAQKKLKAGSFGAPTQQGISYKGLHLYSTVTCVPRHSLT